MFYSETLLSKTGPLARVWLSANLERKLNKSNILQTNLEDSVNAIMDQGQAPMALRLSGQLLLGVARIYSRKARYLMDDCNEALVKIKMAFRPGNNLDLDLATLNPDIAAQNTLMPDTIAGDIPSLPMLDESLFAGGKDIDLPGFDDPLKWSTQIMTSPAVDAPRKTLDFGELYEDDLDLNLDLNDDLELSIELGRDAQPEKSFADSTMLGAGKEQLYDDDLGLPMGDDDDDPTLNFGADIPIVEPMDIDELPEESLLQGRLEGRRASASLSPARSSVAREADETFLTAQTEDPSMVQARQPAVKKRKVLPVDSVTEMKQQQIREMQNDRSAIIKAPSMLPKDPVLLALMEMQQKGLFVSSIMGDGRSKGWAPELRGILSIEVIRKNAKRKRREIEDDLPAEIALEIPEDSAVDITPAIEVTLDEESMQVPGQEHDVDDEDHAAVTHDTFDDTTIPLVHPEDQGPVSQATTHAVHLLRERFGGPEGEELSSPKQQQRQHVIFQQMFPESQTTKADATKMFFEVLVLATKDAIKVDQPENALGGPIKIRAKRGLWGAWAEEKAGGEAFGTQAETAAVEA